MVAKEYCCYTRPYSRIEGFQLAHTLYYSASVEEEGVVLAVRRQQGEECVTEQVICPVGDFGRLMSLMRYLCENGVGLGHWLDVLDDAGVLALHGCKWAAGERKACAICGICWF